MLTRGAQTSRRRRRGEKQAAPVPRSRLPGRGSDGSALCVAQGRGCPSAGPGPWGRALLSLLRPHGAGPPARPAPPAPRPGPARRSPVLRGPPLAEQAEQRAGGGGPGDGGVPRGEELAVGGHGESSAEPPTEHSRAQQPSEGCREGAAPPGPAPPAGRAAPGAGCARPGRQLPLPGSPWQRADPRGRGGEEGAFPPAPAEPGLSPAALAWRSGWAAEPSLPRGPRVNLPRRLLLPSGLRSSTVPGLFV